jgi:hypothetical protein
LATEAYRSAAEDPTGWRGPQVLRPLTQEGLMEDWRTRGIPSSHSAAQTQATAGLLQDALTAMAESRRRADHLHARLFTLLAHLRTQQSSTGHSIAQAELQQEINDLGKSAEAVLDTVELAADALWDASSVVGAPLRQPEPREDRSRSGSESGHNSPSGRTRAAGSLDDITKRDDAKYNR